MNISSEKVDESENLGDHFTASSTAGSASKIKAGVDGWSDDERWKIS